MRLLLALVCNEGLISLQNKSLCLQHLDLFIIKIRNLITTKTDKVNHVCNIDFKLIPQLGLCQFILNKHQIVIKVLRLIIMVMIVFNDLVDNLKNIFL